MFSFPTPLENSKLVNQVTFLVYRRGALFSTHLCDLLPAAKRITRLPGEGWHSQSLTLGKRRKISRRIQATVVAFRLLPLRMKTIASLLVLFAAVAYAADAPTPQAAAKDAPFVNSLGMKFVPIEITGGPTNGKRVLFSIWATRFKDFLRFAKAAHFHTTPGMEAIGVGGVPTWHIDSNASWEHPGFPQTDDHPVVGVTWYDAKAFCMWLTNTERASGKIKKGDKYRLPTDHEWSCAVGLGLQEKAEEPAQTKDGRIEGVYPWGKQWPPPRGAGNFADETAKTAKSCSEFIDGYSDGYAYTSPVGKFAENPFGLYDMGGNVGQWCDDFGDAGRLNRVLRGGSWCLSDAVELLSSSRLIIAEENRNIGFGFRCVLVVGEDK